MLCILPVFSRFAFMGVSPVVDIYAIFRVEPMHTLSLGISKNLKECAVMILKDEERTSSAIPFLNWTARTFNKMKKAILNVLNRFLSEVEKNSAGYGLRVHYSKGECGGRVTRFFHRCWYHRNVGGVGLRFSRSSGPISRRDHRSLLWTVIIRHSDQNIHEVCRYGAEVV